MLLERTTIAAGVLVLTGGLVACGGGGGSSAAAGADAPQNASQDAFCQAIQALTLKSTPREIADQLTKVGTPSDIDASARRGFEVFLGKMRELPDNTSAQDLTKMQTDLSSQDQTDVVAFLTYTQQECNGLPTPPS